MLDYRDDCAWTNGCSISPHERYARFRASLAAVLIDVRRGNGLVAQDRQGRFAFGTALHAQTRTRREPHDTSILCREHRFYPNAWRLIQGSAARMDACGAPQLWGSSRAGASSLNHICSMTPSR